jgi:hypothetical protein
VNVLFFQRNTKPRSGPDIFRPNYTDDNNSYDRVQISIIHRSIPIPASSIIGSEAFVNGKFAGNSQSVATKRYVYHHHLNFLLAKIARTMRHDEERMRYPGGAFFKCLIAQ